MLYLRDDFKEKWKGKDPFEEIEKIDGEVFRSVKARKTFRFDMDGKSYFCKIHRGIGWYEILKDLSQFKMPILGAKNEWEALNRLKELGIDTMTPVAYAVKGINPAKQYSFIVTEDLINTESLEDYCMGWDENPPSYKLKEAFIKRLAWVSKTLHENGINHRDYYICHFLLDISNGKDNIDLDNFTASLIDLHRAQIRSKIPMRWVIKDLAGLYFSAMDLGLNKNDIYKFMKIYSGTSLKECLKNINFWKQIEKRAIKLYIKDMGKEPIKIFKMRKPQAML